MQIELFNSNILVKALKREEKDSVGVTGVYIPTEDLEDEQVSQGSVVKECSFIHPTNHTNVILSVGDKILFHKTLPVDVNMKLEGDTELQNYFFIQFKDIICRIK